MMISTKEFYEICWFVFRLFVAYRIISGICSILFVTTKYFCDTKKGKNKASEIRDEETVKSIIEPIKSDYKNRRIGFMNDTILNKVEP